MFDNIYVLCKFDILRIGNEWIYIIHSYVKEIK